MSDILEALARTPWLDTLGPSGLALLSQTGRVVSYPPGRRIRRRDGSSGEVLLVTSGTLRLGAPGLGRSTSLVALRGVGALLGAVEALTEQDRPEADEVVLETMSVIAMPAETFITLNDTEHRFAARVSRELAALSSQAFTQAKLLSPLPATFRLRQLLLRYAAVCGSEHDGGTRLRPRLTQASLAQDLGVERKFVLRAMNQLRTAGLLRKRNARYFLPNVSALRAWVATKAAKPEASGASAQARASP